MSRIPESVAEALDAIPSPMAVLDNDGRVLGWNLAWRELVGAEAGTGEADYLRLCEILCEGEIQEAHTLASGVGEVLVGRRELFVHTRRWTPRENCWLAIRATRSSGPERAWVFLTVEDVSELKLVEEQLLRHVEFERIVTSLATRFISLRADEIDRGIDEALREIGRFAGIDRSYVFRFREDGSTADNTHEWCADGIEPQIDNLREVPTAAFSWWMERLHRRETVFVPSVSELPPEAAAERRLLEAQDIRSLVVVPLASGERLLGFVGFDSVRKEKLWSREDVSLLQLSGQMLVNLFERHRVEEATRRAEREARRAERMDSVARLAAGVAHEFNNQMMVVLGYGEMLNQDLSSDSRQKKNVREILRAAERASDLIRQLLAFSRRQARAPEELDVNAALSELQDVLARAAGERVMVLLRRGPDAGRVRIDRGELEHALVNLVVNARDAMPDGGTVCVGTDTTVLTTASANLDGPAKPGPYVKITVEDGGVGMSRETRSKMFEPFFGTKPPGAGLGLGLSTVYRIVRDCGGSVRVHSAAGQGTSIQLLLPRIDPGRAEPEAATDGGGSTILLVEDEPAVREFVSRALRERGYRVIAVVDAEETLDRFRNPGERFDLLVVDVVLPGLDGLKLTNRVRAVRPATPVLLMSAHEDSLPFAPPDEHTAALAKPFSVADLLHAVDRLLAGVRNP